jgi:prepilin-type N-terminal cleavage/methylation domain-containing protein
LLKSLLSYSNGYANWAAKKIMIKTSLIPNQAGFTLIEIMAVLVIISVMASVATKKYIDITDVAEYRALQAGITELNSRETLTWTNQKFAPGGYTNDGDIWTAMTTDLIWRTDNDLKPDRFNHYCRRKMAVTSFCFG